MENEEVVTAVLAEQYKNIKETCDEIKDMLRKNAIDLSLHQKDDQRTIHTINISLNKLKTDMTVFKTRWALLTAIAGAALELFLHYNT